MIQQEVRAQLKRYAMARTREEFINQLVDVLSPALVHHYRVTLGTLNNRSDQVEKWQRQEDGFLDEFSDRLLKPTKAKGLDRKKAAAQALRELMENDEARKRIESVTFQKAYSVRSFVPLPEDAHESFLNRVQEIVDVMFPD
jgi:hypothetical protein